MTDVIGMIFSIEEFTVFDGPGIRTSVFLKGCPLRCSWCHSPEGQCYEKQVLKSPNGCISCGACISLAKEKTGREELIRECVDVCPRNLIRVAGEDVTADEVYRRVMKNKDFFACDGGVTFSGGEPLMQADFLIACLERFGGEVNRCVQTSGYCDNEKFRKVAEKTDLFLYDIKIVNSEKMKRYTGGDSHVVLGNLEALVEMKNNFIIRIPLIPGVTDTEENIDDIISVLKKYDIKYAEAMPYNTMAGAKYSLAGRKFMPEYDHFAPVNIPREKFAQNDIELKIL